MSNASFASRLAITLSALLALACAVVTGLNYFKFEKILVAQQARVLHVTAEDLVGTFERSINLGVRLVGVPGAQGRLDASWAADRTIRRLSVVDTTGTILFDTDRTSIGQTIPDAMLRAGEVGELPINGLLWITAPIVNGFRQTEGTLLLAYDPMAARGRLNAIAFEIIRPTALVLAGGIPLAILLCFFLTRTTRERFAAVERAMLGLDATGADPEAASTVRAAVAKVEQALEAAERDIEAAAALRDDGHRA